MFPTSSDPPTWNCPHSSSGSNSRTHVISPVAGFHEKSCVVQVLEDVRAGLCVQGPEPHAFVYRDLKARHLFEFFSDALYKFAGGEHQRPQALAVDRTDFGSRPHLHGMGESFRRVGASPVRIRPENMGFVSRCSSRPAIAPAVVSTSTATVAKPCKSVVIEHASAGTSANRNSPRPSETSVLETVS